MWFKYPSNITIYDTNGCKIIMKYTSRKRDWDPYFGFPIGCVNCNLHWKHFHCWPFNSHYKNVCAGKFVSVNQ